MRAHSLLWILFISAIMLFAPLLKSTEIYSVTLDWERQQAHKWYGDDEAEQISRLGDKVYTFSMIKSGIDPAIRANLEQKKKPTDLISGAIENSQQMSGVVHSMSGYWSGFLLNIYLLCQRLANFWFWFVYLVPFMVAIIFDGIMTRNAKLESFKYTSPTLYNLSWHMIIFIVAGSLLIFALTYQISVFFYPIALSICGLLLRIMIGNIQHSA